jgi:hypothetical protein
LSSTRSRWRRDDSGAFLVVWLVALGAIVGMCALVVNVGQLTSAGAFDQSVVDLAVLAAGPDLSASPPDYLAACESVVSYLTTDANAPPIGPIDAQAFCTESGNNVTQTTCSGGTIAEAEPSVTVNGYTVSLHFPVPESEIEDPNYGVGRDDGAPCQRMRLVLSRASPSLFGAFGGPANVVTTRSATVRASDGASQLVPALWLLDPFGCTSLAISGGSQVAVGTSADAGSVSIDSDGTACNSNQYTLSVSGSGSQLEALSSATGSGVIALEAQPPGASTCVAPACNPADVSAGRVSPQPVNQAERSTRALVDARYDCGIRTIDYYGLVLDEHCTSAPAYMDNLAAAIGTTGLPPGGFERWSSQYSCSPTGTVVVAGNWWVDCPGGFSLGNGTTVEFTGGNVVFDGGITMTGGTLEFNTANPSASLPPGCEPPLVATFGACAGASSAAAAFVYLRSGDLSVRGGQLVLEHVLVDQVAGSIDLTGSALPPTWIAPAEGPFAGLALWSQETATYTLNGGSSLELDGIFFTPGATPLKLTGGGNWGQVHAQLISRQLLVTGGGVLDMSPDATEAIRAPLVAGELIR